MKVGVSFVHKDTKKEGEIVVDSNVYAETGLEVDDNPTVQLLCEMAEHAATTFGVIVINRLAGAITSEQFHSYVEELSKMYSGDECQCPECQKLREDVDKEFLN